MNLSSAYWQRYAELGWSIIPIRENTKKPTVAWQKYQHERPTPEQIREWPRVWPNAGLAVVTGAISGVFVLDVDQIPDLAQNAKEQAKIAKARELVQALETTPTAVARTAKGRHFYFRHPGKPVPTKVRFLPGLDVRGDGGYAILPPTHHPDGALYVWDSIPEDGIADAPEWLMQAILSNESPILESDTDPFGNQTWRSALAGVTEGSRNQSTSKLVGKMLESTPEELWPLQWEALKTWNKERNNPPLSEKELRTTFESIVKREREKRGPTELIVSSVADLDGKELPPPVYAVKNLIYGLTLLVAKPKVGKSAFGLQTAISVCSGQPLFEGEFDIGDDEKLSWETKEGPTLYLDLEDSETRLRDRVTAMTGGKLPANLLYALRAAPMAEGGLKQLQQRIERFHPSLVIIDMFQTFAGIDERSPRNAYQAEYRTMRLLWELSNTTGTPILALQHARKDPQIKGVKLDPLDVVSGTLGSPGAADTVLVMREEKPISLNGVKDKNKCARLYVRGRDVPEYELRLIGNRKTKKWKIG